jgi:hypothetical protein
MGRVNRRKPLPAIVAGKVTRADGWVEIQDANSTAVFRLKAGKSRPKALTAYLNSGKLPTVVVLYPCVSLAEGEFTFAPGLPRLFPDGFDPCAVVLPMIAAPRLSLTTEDKTLKDAAARYLKAMGEVRVKDGKWWTGRDRCQWTCGCSGDADTWASVCARHRWALLADCTAEPAGLCGACGARTREEG